MKKTLLSFLKEEDDGTEAGEAQRQIDLDKDFILGNYYIYLGRPSLINGLEFGAIQFLHAYTTNEGVQFKRVAVDTEEKEENNNELIPAAYFLTYGLLFDTNETEYDVAIKKYNTFSTAIRQSAIGKEAYLPVIMKPIRVKINTATKLGPGVLQSIENWGKSHNLMNFMKLSNKGKI